MLILRDTDTIILINDRTEFPRQIPGHDMDMHWPILLLFTIMHVTHSPLSSKRRHYHYAPHCLPLTELNAMEGRCTLIIIDGAVHDPCRSPLAPSFITIENAHILILVHSAWMTGPQRRDYCGQVLSLLRHHEQPNNNNNPSDGECRIA